MGIAFFFQIPWNESFVDNNQSLIIYLKVAKEIWICEHGTVKKWEGDIFNYKKTLKNKIKSDIEKRK